MRKNIFKKIDPKHIPRIRVALLIYLLLASAVWSYIKVGAVRESYFDRPIERIERAEQDEAYKNASSQILKQAEQLQSWSVLLLTGIVAILVTTKVHRTPGIVWAYLPLGPAAIFLVGSIWAGGWILGRRYIYLVAKNYYFDLFSLSSLLQAQSELFLYAVGCVSVFASWFLFSIVLGKIEPFESNKK